MGRKIISMKKSLIIIVFIWFFGVIWVGAQTPAHNFQTLHYYGTGIEGREIYSELSYSQQWERIELSAGIVALWDADNQLHGFEGISTGINYRLGSTGIVSYKMGAILGNIKNCWEYGILTKIEANGDRVGVGFAGRYSGLRDAGWINYSGAGIFIKYRFL